MAEKHFEEFKKSIEKRDEQMALASSKRRNKSKLPLVGNLQEWLAARHEEKAKSHEEDAFKSVEKHVDALKKKHKL